MTTPKILAFGLNQMAETGEVSQAGQQLALGQGNETELLGHPGVMLRLQVAFQNFKTLHLIHKTVSSELPQLRGCGA